IMKSGSNWSRIQPTPRPSGPASENLKHLTNSQFSTPNSHPMGIENWSDAVCLLWLFPLLVHECPDSRQIDRIRRDAVTFERSPSGDCIGNFEDAPDFVFINAPAGNDVGSSSRSFDCFKFMEGACAAGCETGHDHAANPPPPHQLFALALKAARSDRRRVLA